MGGFNGMTTVSKVESYSLVTRQWKNKQRMSRDRSALTASVITGIEYTKEYSALNQFADKFQYFEK